MNPEDHRKDTRRKAEVTTSEIQGNLTPAQVLEDLKAGNDRFVNGNPKEKDYGFQMKATASGQFPKAAVLTCLDSRIPVETIFDQGIGDIFVG